MSAEKAVNIDRVLLLGRYTVFVCIIAEFLVLSQLGNMLYMVYAGAAPTIRSCGPHKFAPEMSSKDICKQLDELKQNETCKPELQYDFKSMNVEFDYLCHDNKYVKDSISVQMTGVIIGSLIFGHISDRYGRKPTVIFCLTGCALFGLLSAFSKDLFTVTIYRTTIGFFNGGQIVSLIVYLVEILPKKHRIWVTTVICWSPNVALFAAIAYYSENWRTLAVTTSVLSLPAVLLFIIAYESPRWLVQKGRMDEAHDVLRKITRFNGRRGITDDMIDEVIDKEKKKLRGSSRKTYYIYHLFHTRELATFTIVLSYSFLSASLLNYGLLFNMEKLSGSIYTNNIFLGLLRYAVNITWAVTDYTQKWFGRRMAHTVPLALVALGFSINFVIVCLGLAVQLETFARAVTLMAFAAASQIYIISGMTSNELFPTPIRSICFSFMQIVSRIGVVFAPQLFFLAEYWTAAPFLTLIVFALVDLVLYLMFIPETKGRPLRDRLSISLAQEQATPELGKLSSTP